MNNKFRFNTFNFFLRNLKNLCFKVCSQLFKIQLYGFSKREEVQVCGIINKTTNKI